MSTVAPADDAHPDARVRAVFDDIRTTRGSDFINNFWRYLPLTPTCWKPPGPRSSA